jgi:ABC-type antimicrobial peptide transport system permease subunit
VLQTPAGALFARWSGETTPTSQRLVRTLELTAAGVIAAFFLSRLLSSILFGITALDVVTFVAVPPCLIGIALLAGYLPARRATRADPVSSLRHE